jgi:hypothetical protein
MSVGGMPLKHVRKNESTAAERRLYFHCVDVTDGFTPETGEAAGQPQISTNGAAWTNTGIGTLNAIGQGWYYADVTQATVNANSGIILGRYKSAATREAGALFGLCIGSENENGPNRILNTTSLDLDTGILTVAEADGSTGAHTFTLAEVDDDTQQLTRS